MLGYVRTDVQELRVREHQYYRALYCGLCHRMGKCTGQCSRMTLSYDFVFLAALRLSLTGEQVEIKKQRCLIHPFRKRPTAQKCDALDFCADASALLIYHKLADDLSDERGLKRLSSLLFRPVLSRSYRRAKKRYPALDAVIREQLRALTAYENDRSSFASADELSTCFGTLMEAVFSEGLTGTNARIAATMGRALGRWLYLIDAADDLEQDRKLGRFNPFLHTLENPPTRADWENLRLALTALLCEAERGFLLIDSYPAPELKEILSNVLYRGLVQAGEKYTTQTLSSYEEHSER